MTPRRRVLSVGFPTLSTKEASGVSTLQH